MSQAITVAGRAYSVRRSATPGYSYDVLRPGESWSGEERILTRRGPVLLGPGQGQKTWQPVHALNHPEIYEACRLALGDPRGAMR